MSRKATIANSTLTHRILDILYLNSRASITEVAEKLGVSHYTASKYVKTTVEKYSPFFTLDIDSDLLGFSEPRLLAIKFGTKPKNGELKEMLKSPFVQNAYACSGDYDLVIHAIARNPDEYNYWQFDLKKQLYNYEPTVEQASINIAEGFLPVRNSLLKLSDNISEEEMDILTVLLKDSRVKLNQLVKESRVSQMKVIYKLKKLQENGVIRKFSSLVQAPNKRLFVFYTVSIMPSENHHPHFVLKLMDRVMKGYSGNEATMDYSVIGDAAGHFDGFYFCSFEDGNAMERFGPSMLSNIWRDERPKLKQCMLTTVIIGKWPFSLNCYRRWNKERDYLITRYKIAEGASNGGKS